MFRKLILLLSASLLLANFVHADVTYEVGRLIGNYYEVRVYNDTPDKIVYTLTAMTMTGPIRTADWPLEPGANSSRNVGLGYPTNVEVTWKLYTDWLKEN